MRSVIQRVNHCEVKSSGQSLSKIGSGLLILVGFSKEAQETQLQINAKKIANMRLFADGDKHFHLSILETGGSVLVVSQFTLCAELSRGRRPDFFSAMEPAKAILFYEKFLTELRSAGIQDVQAGKFGADMQVSLENDGPVTIILS